MEENFIQSKEYTHKILDYKNGGICVFYGSKKDCENYLKLNKSKMIN